MSAQALRPFVALVALAVSIGAGPVAAQWDSDGASLTDATYISPTWGYEVRWHSGEWTATAEEANRGSDVLQLENAQGEIVRYEATDRFGTDPVACRDALLTQIAQAPGVRDLDIVPTDEGTLIWQDGMAQAFGFYQYRRESGGVTTDWAAYFDCRALNPDGDALLALSQIGPSAVYDVMHAQLNRVTPARGMVLPFVDAEQAFGWVWTPDCFSGPIEDTLDDAAFRDGSQPTPGTRFFLLRLRLVTPFAFAAPQRYDATTINLIDENDVRHEPVSFAWSDIAGDSTAAAQEIAVGTGADLTLVYELPIGVDAASVLETPPGAGGSLPAMTLGCLAARNGLAVRPQIGPGEPQISFVMNPDGTEAGMLTWLDGATLPGEGDVLLLRFANTGAADWSVDPRAIAGGNRLAGPNAARVEPSAVALLDSASGQPIAVDAPVTLAPGEFVDARLTFAAEAIDCVSLSYAVAPDQIVPAGDGPCSAGGGGFPRLRTSG